MSVENMSLADAKKLMEKAKDKIQLVISRAGCPVRSQSNVNANAAATGFYVYISIFGVVS